MAEIIGRPNVNLDLTFRINEAEARALEDLAGYGDDNFIKAFYEKLGKCYMEKHEAGLRSFLCSVRSFLPPQLAALDEARKAFLSLPGRVGLYKGPETKP